MVAPKPKGSALYVPSSVTGDISIGALSALVDAASEESPLSGAEIASMITMGMGLVSSGVTTASTSSLPTKGRIDDTVPSSPYFTNARRAGKSVAMAAIRKFMDSPVTTGPDVGSW